MLQHICVVLTDINEGLQETLLGYEPSICCISSSFLSFHWQTCAETCIAELLRALQSARSFKCGRGLGRGGTRSSVKIEQRDWM